MGKLKPIFFLMYSLMLLLALSCTGEKSTPVLKRHEAQYPDIRKKYLYQSVIRLANTTGDPAFNMLIKDVRKIIIYLPPREDTIYHITEVRSGMRADGFEELVDVRTTDGNRISLWVNESKSLPYYMGLLDTEEDDYIFEIDGQLNLKYLSSVKIADQGSIMDLIN